MADERQIYEYEIPVSASLAFPGIIKATQFSMLIQKLCSSMFSALIRFKLLGTKALNDEYGLGFPRAFFCC